MKLNELIISISLFLASMFVLGALAKWVDKL